ncbi:MAG: hypothetical protein K6U03_06145 [Firmicutes bacterium]|nr:hypothetical protein [Bacillota bacterium]
MPIKEARRLLPDGIFIGGDIDFLRLSSQALQHGCIQLDPQSLRLRGDPVCRQIRPGSAAASNAL